MRGSSYAHFRVAPDH